MTDVDIVDSIDEKVLQEIFNLMFDDEGEVDPVFRETPPEWYDDDEGDDDDVESDEYDGDE